MADDTTPFQTLPGPNGDALAYRLVEGAGPTVVWLGGYGSDMDGTKAEHLARAAAREKTRFLRFDYGGHGASGGRFEDGTITSWSADALAVVDALAPRGDLVLVGSSMGAWIALRLARALRERGEGERLRGLLLLAPAPDFTERLVEPGLTAAEREDLARDGLIRRPSPYGDRPTVYTRALIEDGRGAGVMNGPMDLGCPVHVIQGQEDADVPTSHALALVALLPADAVSLTLVRDGDHRLSRPEDLARMDGALAHLRTPVDAPPRT